MSYLKMFFVEGPSADGKHLSYFGHPFDGIVLHDLLLPFLRGGIDRKVADVLASFLADERFEGRRNIFHKLVLKMLGPFVGVVRPVPGMDRSPFTGGQEADHAVGMLGRGREVAVHQQVFTERRQSLVIHVVSLCG